MRTDIDSLFGAIALATAGGTVSSTIAALFIVPVLALRGKRSKPRRAVRR
ncbi:MAG: hypothetical protein ACOY71_02665 [Gemmatimonadota bacterium]